MHAFTHLRIDYKYGGAPHKPVLVLSLINGFSEGLFTTSKIHITPEFVGLFKSLWNKYVDSPRHTPRFSLPFYHLKNEKANYWRLIPNAECEKWVESKSSMRSFNSLKSAVAYAEIDIELAELLLLEENRELLEMAILEKYFSHSSNANSKDYLNNISNEILNDSAEEYKQRIQKLQSLLDKSDFQEEIYVRSGRFKREVLSAYNDTCAISGLKITTTENISMLDACHIIPFSETYDDTISNGIALTPTLHRAFDRGLIGINSSYEVVLSADFKENSSSPYCLSQFLGKRLILPINTHKYPSKGKLQTQLLRYFKNGRFNEYN